MTKQIGRPSSYTPETAGVICDRIASGFSLRAVCDMDDMPSKATVLRWLYQNAEFQTQYARAREIQADAIFEEILEIADTPQIGTKTVSKATGLEVTEGDMIEHRRLQVDARKWIASKLAPKKYGERQAIEHSVDTDTAQRILEARKRAGGG